MTCFMYTCFIVRIHYHKWYNYFLIVKEFFHVNVITKVHTFITVTLSLSQERVVKIVVL